MTGDRVLVVGAGVAGAAVVTALRERGHHGPVTVLCAERRRPYDRPPLSKQILTSPGKPNLAEVALGGPDRADHSTTWVFGLAATGLDRCRREVQTADQGPRFCYDRLVVATGARARRPRLGAELPVLRSLTDALLLRHRLHTATGHLVIIGAGFVGSELTAAARGLGWSVTVLDRDPVPLRHAVGPSTARWIWLQHQLRGVRTRFGTGTVAVAHDPWGRWRVDLDDGSSVDADLTVAAVGAEPVTDWLADAGLDLTDGVATDSSLRALTHEGTALESVLAIGDLARAPCPLLGRAVRVEHWSSAQAHAGLVAQILTQDEVQPPVLSAPPVFWTDLYEHRVQVVGHPGAGVETGHESERGGVAVHFGDDTGPVATVAVDWPARLATAYGRLRSRARQEAA